MAQFNEFYHLKASDFTPFASSLKFFSFYFCIDSRIGCSGYYTVVVVVVIVVVVCVVVVCIHMLFNHDWISECFNQ